MAKKEVKKRELETESPSYLQEVQERPLSLGCRVSGRLESEQTESQIALVRRREISPAHKDYSTVIPLGPHEPCTHLAWKTFPFPATSLTSCKSLLHQELFLIYPYPLCIHSMVSTKSFCTSFHS